MPFKVRTPEHRQRSAFGNTHAGSHRGQRIPTKQQFAVRHAIHVDMWGKAHPGIGHPEYAAHSRPARPSTAGNIPLSPKRAELAMKYALRATTAEVPYNPDTLKPMPIARTCVLSPEGIQAQKVSRGGLWSPESHGRTMAKGYDPQYSWKVHSRVGPIGESPNAVPRLRASQFNSYLQLK
eukprot:TRINITY_DN2159_c0_g1_i6.p1 TRINITY_DN2159_c0_g1~~TRINITY_DN2159_c0_g1_i6.p1  ORF type:complete len:180 (-),score=9.00 TRINITY_DN2159_c0_g1_i6:56-595(-)